MSGSDSWSMLFALASAAWHGIFVLEPQPVVKVPSSQIAVASAG